MSNIKTGNFYGKPADQKVPGTPAEAERPYALPVITRGARCSRCPQAEYDHVMEMLEQLEIGDAIQRDCRVDEIASDFVESTLPPRIAEIAMRSLDSIR